MKDQDKKKQSYFDPFDGEYIGNIWGWRNSYIALAFLLFMMGLAAINYDPDKVSTAEPKPIEVYPDSIHQTPIR